MLNDEFDKAVKFFLTVQLYAHLQYEQTNFLLFLFFVTLNLTGLLVWI